MNCHLTRDLFFLFIIPFHCAEIVIHQILRFKYHRIKTAPGFWNHIGRFPRKYSICIIIFRQHRTSQPVTAENRRGSRKYQLMNLFSLYNNHTHSVKSLIPGPGNFKIYVVSSHIHIGWAEGCCILSLFGAISDDSILICLNRDTMRISVKISGIPLGLNLQRIFFYSHIRTPGKRDIIGLNYPEIRTICSRKCILWTLVHRKLSFFCPIFNPSRLILGHSDGVGLSIINSSIGISLYC